MGGGGLTASCSAVWGRNIRFCCLEAAVMGG